MEEQAKADQESHLWIKGIKENDKVHGLYLVKAKKTGLTRKGDPFLSITLADRTGELEAKVWERVEELSPIFNEGDILDVKGYAGSYRNQIQITLSSLKVTEKGGDPALFLEASNRDVSEMMRSLREIFQEIEGLHLKALIDRFFSDHHFISLFKKAPAAKNFHHNYIGGLLEHTLSICQMVKPVTEHYPELDRDILIAGAFLHDIGKVRELRFDYKIDYTDEGRLLGHLMLGVAMLDEKLASMKNFPQELALRLKHLMLSHHGEYEFGSPKRPKFLEAFALHLLDDLDAKMNGLGRFMERDGHEGGWTDFNRLFERYFFKDRIQMMEGKTENSPSMDDDQKRLFEITDP